MKKRLLLIIIPFIIIAIGSYIFLTNRVTKKIYIEINPSIEININKNNKIIKVIPLNEDAKEIISSNIKGKDLDAALSIIADNIINKGYVKDREVPLLLYSENYNTDELIHKLVLIFDDREVHATITAVSNVTKEDIELSKKHGISIVRAAYIGEITKNNQNIDASTLINKSVNELRQTKETGQYCDRGYFLDGNFCLKETRRLEAEIGNVCPEGYYNYEDICYEETGSIETDELVCPEGYTMTSDSRCTGTERIEATPNFTCANGEAIKRENLPIPSLREAGDPKEYLCEDRSNAKYPTERCLLQEHAMINGKCAMGPKPLLPTPTGCEGHDINYNGGCYDPYPSEPYICPNGDRYDTNTELCPDTFTYIKASGSYSCPKGYALSGSECSRNVTIDAPHKRVCKEGYSSVNDGRCINKDKTTNHISGHVCPYPDSRQEGNICILYERVDANRSN